MIVEVERMNSTFVIVRPGEGLAVARSVIGAAET
jgi:hypothetical protein